MLEPGDVDARREPEGAQVSEGGRGRRGRSSTSFSCAFKDASRKSYSIAVLGVASSMNASKREAEQTSRLDLSVLRATTCVMRTVMLPPHRLASNHEIHAASQENGRRGMSWPDKARFVYGV